MPNSPPATAHTKKAARPIIDCTGVANAACVATTLMLHAAPPAAIRTVFIGALIDATSARPIKTAAAAVRTSVDASACPGYIWPTQLRTRPPADAPATVHASSRTYVPRDFTTRSTVSFLTDHWTRELCAHISVNPTRESVKPLFEYASNVANDPAQSAMRGSITI
jgi:hypothetical protein